MAEWYKPFSVTAINFPETDSTFDKCYEFLKDGKKKLLIPLLKIKFPDYYAKGKVNAELQEIIDKYQKPYKKGDSPKTVFFNWNVKNDDEDKTKKLLNNHFKGGASEFVIDLLMSVMNFVNTNMVTYSSSTTEKPVEKKVSAAVERPASAPTPVSVDTEDDGVNPASLLTQFNDSGEYSSLINADDNKTTDDRILADNEDPSLQFK